MNSKELPKIYDPHKVEDEIYKKWEESGYFNPDNLDLPKDAPTYSIILPPPNITDKLHLGHSAMLAIEDLLIRFYRMRGYRTLWVPGTDHAAIATQNVVEKKLFKETGKDRHSLGKEKFLKEIWKFIKVTQSTILHQTRKMGSSLDWSREAFTLDDQRQKAVKKIFIDMYKAGIIYRGERIVNWCPRCHSTLADDEIEYKEQSTKLYWIKYGPFVLATTRPETKLGDTAVAVNPKDKRYKDMVGKDYMIPGVLGKFKIKVIADYAVDMDFGSGAVKVTPAHSFIDNEMAQRHGVPMKKIIDEDGKMMENCGKYAGMPIQKARKEIVKDMKKMDLIDNIDENYNNKLSVCYRCDTPIEPLPSKQWFVAVDKKLKRLGNKSLKEKAIEVAKEKEIEFFPERFEKRYLNWMENLHDWCISRQIWFGHSIPAWHKKTKNSTEEIYVGMKPPKDNKNWTQDPDSLDTWFSSGMWTFSTLGWPDNFKGGRKTGDLEKYHPTQVLETGYEILTLWVSRMIMMSLFAVGEIPFKHVYLHGMVLDERGKKMSKSKGNGIDPIDMINKYGTDAVRLSLLIGNTPGNDVRIGEEKIESFRNFSNKLWNISRFIIQKIEKTDSEEKIENITLADRWIIRKMSTLIEETTKDLEEYKFSQAGERLYNFTWHDFADWYIEISKFEDNEKEKNIILIKMLEDLLKLWHPFIPFITENIWNHLDKEKFIMIESYPKKENYSDEFLKASNADITNFDAIVEIIKSIRALRTENKIETNKKIDILINSTDAIGLQSKAVNNFIKSQENIIKNIRTSVGKIKFVDKKEKINNSISRTTSNGITIYVPLKGLIDIDKEKSSTKKDIKNLENYIAGLKKKLSNKGFVRKAPEKVITQEKEKLKKAQTKIKELKKYLKQL